MSLELFWLGQSGFRLRAPDSSAPTVFCDPFLSAHEDRTWEAPIDARALAEQADIVLVSHEHIDHLDRPTLQAAATCGGHFSVVAPRPIVSQITALGIPSDRVVGAQPDEPITLDGLTIRPVPACHGVNVSDAYTFGEELSNGLTRYLGYVLELGGVRIYHAGDCIPYAGQIERLKDLRPRVVCLPINGRDFYRESERNIVGNMDFREAAKLAHEVGAEVLVPMHWELFPHNRGFPGDLLAYVGDNFPELSVLVMGRAARVLLSKE